MISIITTLMQPVITIGANLFLWHMLLFVIILMVYYDSRNGFNKTISVSKMTFFFLVRNNTNNAIDNTVSRYRDKSKKVYLIDSIKVVVVVLLFALILYFKLIYFTIVVSDSMDPTVRKGDLILMQNIYANPKVGDIIAFSVPSVQLPITHRIISISGDGIRTKGDNNPGDDPWTVSRKDILGVNIISSGQPIVIRDVGNYLLVDASVTGKTYGPEFMAMATLIQGIKVTGLIIFGICMFLYMLVSVRESRRTKW